MHLILLLIVLRTFPKNKIWKYFLKNIIFFGKIGNIELLIIVL